MTLKLNKLVALVGVALGTLAAAPSAFAAAQGMAQSVRQLSNFGLYNSGGTLISVSDFVPNSFTFTDTASVAANLNGVNASQNTAVNSQPPSPPTNLTQACIGTCGFAQDDYTHHSTVTGTFARSDQALSGVLINGIQKAGAPTGTFEPSPASSALLAEVQIQNAGSGNAQTTSGTGGSVIFTPASSGAVTIKFNANDWLYSFVNPATDMFASNSLSFKLTADNVTVFSWSPDGTLFSGAGTILTDPCSLNATVNATFLNSGVPQTFACSGFFSAVTPILQAGTVYNLTFAETTTVGGTVIQAVPEPGSLALVGAALGVLGLARRRSAKKA